MSGITARGPTIQTRIVAPSAHSRRKGLFTTVYSVHAPGELAPTPPSGSPGLVMTTDSQALSATGIAMGGC
ncbi:hypothetical protein BO78DRAFT_394270 [Aspergillus sclerotiicarbonarius CBS 121057]|uniref:Uncharacterized protein n=1 Tax=Aspergillus sclerotiicarbonarius (strain CBS 121057 / IBT 28362) TaxID=1448318 RepID=A0A319FM19_ASPSB|nr:hypothetical protein BO78DRAFT_394270 [Aspergillus sclerotiicarbonarius CBS 121057]